MKERKYKYFYLGNLKLSDEKEYLINYFLDLLQKTEQSVIEPASDIENAVSLLKKAGLNFLQVFEDDKEVMYMFSDDIGFMHQATFLSEEIHRI